MPSQPASQSQPLFSFFSLTMLQGIISFMGIEARLVWLPIGFWYDGRLVNRWRVPILSYRPIAFARGLNFFF